MRPLLQPLLVVLMILELAWFPHTRTASADSPPKLVLPGGHSLGVTSIALSHDGSWMATWGFDGYVRLWDTARGWHLRSIPLRSTAAVSVAISPDGKFIATGRGGFAEIWDTDAGTLVTKLVPPGAVIPREHPYSGPVAFSADGRLLAMDGGYAQGERHVVVWHVGTWQQAAYKFDLKSMGLIRELKFTADGRFLQSVSDFSINLWNLETGTLASEQQGSDITAADMDATGSVLVTGGWSDTVSVWGMPAGKKLLSLSGPRPQSNVFVHAIAISPDRRYLAACDGEAFSIWNISDGALIYQSDHDAAVLAFTPGGDVMLADSLGTVSLFSMGKRAIVRTYRQDGNRLGKISLSADGRLLAGVSEYSDSVRLWDLRRGEELAPLIDQGRDFRDALLSQDGRLIATSDDQGNISLWDVETRRRQHRFPGSNALTSLVFNSRGTILAAGGHQLRDTIVWDVKTGSEIAHFKNPAVHNPHIAISPDGQLITETSGTQVIVRHCCDSFESIKILDPDAGGLFFPGPMVFAPDSKTLAGAAFETIIFWDTQTWQVRKLAGPRGRTISALAFSHDGKHLATGDTAGAIIIYDYASGAKIAEVTGYEGRVDSLSFAPDDAWFAGGSSDGTVRLWSTNSKTSIATLTSGGTRAWAAIAPNGLFDGALSAVQRFLWRFNNNTFDVSPVEAGFRDFYRPQLLMKLLGAGVGLSPRRDINELNRARPVVTITNVAEKPGIPGEVSVAVEVRNQQATFRRSDQTETMKSGAYDLHLFRDGHEVGRWAGGKDHGERGTCAGDAELTDWRRSHALPIDPTTGTVNYTFHDIKLPKRRDRQKVEFTAYAFNCDRIKSDTSSVYVYPLRPPFLRAVPKAYVVTVGVGANESGWYLDFAVASAVDAERLIRKRLATKYTIVDVPLFSSLEEYSPKVDRKDATKHKMQLVFDLLAGRPVSSADRDAVDKDAKISAATPDDAVIVFISSHGYADPHGNFYVVPYDTGEPRGVTEAVLERCNGSSASSDECDDARTFLGRTISSDDLVAWWSGVDAGEMVLILDSCHSAAVSGRDFRAGPLGDAGFGQLAYDKGLRVLAATQPDKTARATLLQGVNHSLLVEALTRAVPSDPAQGLGDWLAAAEQWLPRVTRLLYPEWREADLQVGRLLDFSRAHDESVGSRE